MASLFEKKFEIKLYWIVIVGLIVLFGIVFFVLNSIYEFRKITSFDYTVKFVLATLAFLTLLYHLYNLENQIKTHKLSNRQNLAKYTYDICSDFRKPMMMEINEDLRCLLNAQQKNLEKGKIKKFVEYIENPVNRSQRQALIITLNYFESISAMVEAGDLDNDIVKRLFGRLFGRYYERLSYYIEFRQIESPRSWVNYEALAKKWLNDDKK